MKNLDCQLARILGPMYSKLMRKELESHPFIQSIVVSSFLDQSHRTTVWLSPSREKLFVDLSHPSGQLKEEININAGFRPANYSESIAFIVLKALAPDSATADDWAAGKIRNKKSHIKEDQKWSG